PLQLAFDLAAVAGMDDASEHASRRTTQSQRVDTRALQGFPRQLEHQSLLWIHRQRLAGADAEEPGIEIACIAEKRSLPYVHLAGGTGVVIDHPRAVPAPVRGKVRYGVAALNDHLPQRLWRIHTTRIPAGHP